MNNLALNTKNYTPVDYENLTVKFENNRVYNLATNKDYAGKNKERLIEFCKENKFKYTIFLSFKQAQGLGLKIKKGSKGCRIFADFTVEKPMQDANGNVIMENADTPKTTSEHKGFAMQPVFNIEQLELWTDKEGNKYLNTEFKHNELIDFINNDYQIIESKKAKVKAKSKALPKADAVKNTKAKTKKTTDAKDTKASDTKDVNVSDVKDTKAPDTKASELNTDKIEVINVTSISEHEQKQSEDMNTNNTSTKDFKDIVLTDELKTVIKAALKFVAPKHEFRERLQHVQITNLNDKLNVLASDAHAIFRFETDIDLPLFEYGHISASIMHDKDFKTKLENAISFKDLEISDNESASMIELYIQTFNRTKTEQSLNTSIDLNGNLFELVAKTCKELCSKRNAGFNLEVHDTYAFVKLHLLEKFKGNCTVILSHLVV